MPSKSCPHCGKLFLTANELNRHIGHSKKCLADHKTEVTQANEQEPLDLDEDEAFGDVDLDIEVEEMDANSFSIEPLDFNEPRASSHTADLEPSL
ncbi:uncharacterized protein EV420DRAFT_1645866 [Desarmillaria tabescens]|uniref:C2H2-type domain-containing protein n=1 Tax=Armillaria tabescens TaxID=1929756 RepID=A0AA39JZT6_ARMTA|nr:uncharacterized protein EV420DRAFT_1645866 [Desarmillaria tabescens]KAK0451957.1 hypothetical protein EV420DRAFT_1645866 [Desarmillaria tabescens]